MSTSTSVTRPTLRRCMVKMNLHLSHSTNSQALYGKEDHNCEDKIWFNPWIYRTLTAAHCFQTQVLILKSPSTDQFVLCDFYCRFSRLLQRTIQGYFHEHLNNWNHQNIDVSKYIILKHTKLCKIHAFLFFFTRIYKLQLLNELSLCWLSWIN